MEALEAQLGSARRLDGLIGGADAKLRLLDARMAEAVARAIELSAPAGDDAVSGSPGVRLGADLGADVDGSSPRWSCCARRSTKPGATYPVRASAARPSAEGEACPPSAGRPVASRTVSAPVPGAYAPAPGPLAALPALLRDEPR